jgi:hypothetical protein
MVENKFEKKNCHMNGKVTTWNEILNYVIHQTLLD